MAQKVFNNVEAGVDVKRIGAGVRGSGRGGTCFDLLAR